MLDDFEHFLRMKKSCANNAAVRYLRCVKNVLQYAWREVWRFFQANATEYPVPACSSTPSE
jgi:hypothetical protein